MYSWVKKFKKVLIWTLVLIISSANLFSFFAVPKKALAAEEDPANPGFMKPDNEHPPAAPVDISYDTDAQDKHIIIYWKINKADVVKSIDELNSERFTKLVGFRFKTANKATLECDTDSFKNLTNCSGETITISASFPLGRYTNYFNFFNNGPDQVQFELHDRSVQIDKIPEGTWLGVQTYGFYGRDYIQKRYSNVNKFQVRSQAVDLGDAFSDANIDAYIKNKLKPYTVNGGKLDSQCRPDPNPLKVGPACKSDQDYFKQFMESLKSGGSMRPILQDILNSANQDPFGSAKTQINGETYSLLTEADISQIRSNYFQAIKTGTQEEFGNAMASIYKKVQDVFNDPDKKSCTELNNRLQNSIVWKGIYSQIGALIGGGVAAFYSGGLFTIAGSAAGSGIVGKTIEDAIRNGQVSAADKDLQVFTVEYYRMVYSLYYLTFKEAYIGLSKYKSEGEALDQDTGLNPFKSNALNKGLESVNKSYTDCFTNITSAQEKLGEDNCGISTTKTGILSYWLASALCQILKLVASIGGWLINALFTSVFNAYHPPPARLSLFSTIASPFNVQHAYAITVNPGDEYSPPSSTGTPLSGLVQELTAGKGTWKWVIPAWKFSLGLTNLLLVVVLLFLGIVNILHIQYDTYNLKKMLPLLIVGVILANFSLLIMRMLLDASNILTNSFMTSDPGTTFSNLVTNVGLKDGVPGFAQGWSNVGGLFLAVIFSVFALAGFLILGFMFYIRYAAIILLAIAAPLAFVAMAFPPTQSIFKQWWSWTSKMIFMKPIAFFLIFVASQIISSKEAGNSITAWIIVTFLVYMAILVPWKLGGAVMAFWGGVGGALFGTKKGGWARKPVEDWGKRRLDKAGAFVRKTLPGLFAGGEKDRQTVESMKKTADARVKAVAERDAKLQAARGETQTAENKLNSLMKKNQEAYEKGELKMGWWMRLMFGGVKWQGGKPKVRTGRDLAQDAAFSAAELILRTKDLESGQKDRTAVAMTQIARDDNELSDILTQMKEKGIGVPGVNIDVEGKINRKYKTKEDGTPELDEKGNPIQEVGDVRQTWEMISQLRTRALLVGKNQPELARNLEQSANELEKMISDFQQNNPTFGGKPINFTAFMDKQYAGRTLSGITPWALEDVSTNLLNGNPNERYQRSINGSGNRNLRFTQAVLDSMASGKRSKLDAMDSLAAGVFLVEWLQAMERGGKKNRVLDFHNFLRRFDSGKHLGEDGILLQKLLEKEERLSPGKATGFLAEQIINARRRGGQIEGLEDVRIGNKEEVAADLKKKINASDYIKNHRGIFTQVDLESRGAMTVDTMALFNGLTDSITEMPIFCGGGNPVIQMQKTTDIAPEKIFSALENEDPKDTLERRQKKEAQRETYERQETVLRQSEPDSIEQQTEARGARKVYDANQKTIEDLDSERQQISTQFRAGGQPLSNEQFQRLIQSIGGITADSLSGLQERLRDALQLPDLTLSADLKLDTAEAIENFKTELVSLQRGLINADIIRTQAAAEETVPYGPIKKNESDESIQKSLAELKEAAELFNKTAENLSKAGKTAADIPESVMDKIIQAISSRGQVIPLSKKVLETNPAELNQVLSKMILTLTAASRLKQNQRGVDDLTLLRSIRQELRNLNREVQGGAQPPTPAAPSAGAPAATPPAPTPPAAGTPEKPIIPGSNAPENQ